MNGEVLVTVCPLTFWPSIRPTKPGTSEGGGPAGTSSVTRTYIPLKYPFPGSGHMGSWAPLNGPAVKTLSSLVDEYRNNLPP